MQLRSRSHSSPEQTAYRTGYDVAVTLLDAVLEAGHGLPPR
jgi:soluble cytochrome b562